MHVPDGFLDSPTCVVTGVIAVAGVTHAVRTLPRELPQDRQVPLAGLVATLVFATQMVNVAVGDGTSGHLLGGALAAVLVGPATAVVCIAAILAVQAVFFADGGITALGTNITLMALVGVLVGWVVFRGLQSLLPRTVAGTSLAAAGGGLVSVPAAAGVFAALFAIGGQASVAWVDFASAMLGWHTVIGLVEAAITGTVVALVASARPDLVHGLRRREEVAA